MEHIAILNQLSPDDKELLIAGAVAEVDPRQIAIYRQLSPAQRVWQLAHLSDWLRQANERRAQRLTRPKGAMTVPENHQQPQMGLIDFARLVIDALETAGAEYMLAGALAVAAWAEARSTQDVDIVISIPIERIKRLSEELEKRAMLVPVDIILDLFLEDQADLPVNAIHLDTGYKAELFLLRPEDEYRAVAFSRRKLVDLGPPLGKVYVHAPEDLILYKLHYFSLSRQPKHLRDITSILLAMGDELDLAHIETWAQRLDLAVLWHKVYRQAHNSESSNYAT